MKLGFSNTTTMTSNLETDVAISVQAGFTGMDIWASKLDTYLASHSIDDLKALLANHAMAPMGFGVIEFIGFRGNEYPQVQARCKELSRIARAIGCPTIVPVPSPLPDRSLTWADIKKEYVTVLRDLGHIAGEEGVQLAFEFLGFGWASIRTPRAAWEIIQEVDLKNVGMAFDTAHFYGGGGSLQELAQVDPARIFAYHLNDLEDLPKEAFSDSIRLYPGEGVIPLDEINACLKQIGYAGPCTVELFRPEYWADDPTRVAKKARESAVRILSPYFELE